MKKIAWFCTVLVLIFVLFAVQKRPLSRFRFGQDATFVVTAYDRPLSTSFWTVVENGEAFVITTTTNYVGWLMANIEQPIGQSWHVVTQNEIATRNEIITLLQGYIFSVEVLPTGEVYNGYSPLLPKGVYHRGHRQNFQLAVSENAVVIGWPLILESY